MCVAGAMLFPGLAAFVVRRWVRREGFGDAGLRMGPGRLYVQAWALMPLVFLAVYILTAVLVAAPDFSLRSFCVRYGIPLEKLPSHPWLLLLGVGTGTLTFSPFVNAIPAFGEEFGWRGYLLPRLLPLGPRRALLLSSLVWGLWHVPLVLIGHGQYTNRWAGAAVFTVMVMGFGVYVGYLRLASRSSVLAAFAHGAFNAQAYGAWGAVFPASGDLLGGITGIIGVAVVWGVALWVLTHGVPNLRNDPKSEIYRDAGPQAITRRCT